MESNNSFYKIIKNYQRYCRYEKEAKNSLKTIKKLEESFDNTCYQTDLFLSQLVRLCTCKNDNVLLNDLGQDIAFVKSDFKKINISYKENFNGIINQLIHISNQFNAVQTIEKKYKKAHSNRVSYERKKNSIIQLIANVFSTKAHENDFINFSSTLKNDYIDTYTGTKPIDHKLAKLINEELNLKNEITTQFLNHELSIVIRIRKLVRMFAENQVNHQRNLITLFSQLNLVTGDVPEAILGLNNKELEKYLRPRKLLPTIDSSLRVANAKKVELNPYSQKTDEETKGKKSLSSDSSYKDQILKNLLRKSPDPGKNLYYKSLNLNDKFNEKIEKKNCQICHPEGMQEKVRGKIDQTESPINQLIWDITADKNLFYETSYHKCKLNHKDSINLTPFDLQLKEGFNLDELQKDKTCSISQTASAPPLEEQKMINLDKNESQISLAKVKKPLEERALERRDPSSLIDNPLWLNKDYCQDCKNQQLKVEESALVFFNNFKKLEEQINNCKNFRKFN